MKATSPPTIVGAGGRAAPSRVIAAVTDTRVRMVVRAFGIFYRAVAASLILLGTFGVVAILIARNFSSSQPAWAVEGYTLALVTGGMLFVGDVVRHIGFGGVPRLTRASPVLTALVQAAFALFVYFMLAWQGVKAVQIFYDNGTHTPSGAISMWIVYVAVPLVGIRGILSTAARLAQQLWPGTFGPPPDETALELPVASDAGGGSVAPDPTSEGREA